MMDPDRIMEAAQKKLEETGCKTELMRTLNEDGEVIGWNIKIIGRLE